MSTAGGIGENVRQSVAEAAWVAGRGCGRVVGGGGGWWRRKDAGRADAVVAAREAAQESFYALDTARRAAEVDVESVRVMADGAADADGRARLAVAEFVNLSARIEQVTVGFLEAVDAPAIGPDGETAARQGLEQARRELEAKRAELDGFVRRLHPLVQQAEAAGS